MAKYLFIELTRGRNLLTTSYLKTALQQTKLQQGRKILQPCGETVLGFCVMLLIHPWCFCDVCDIGAWHALHSCCMYDIHDACVMFVMPLCCMCDMCGACAAFVTFIIYKDCMFDIHDICALWCVCVCVWCLWYMCLVCVCVCVCDLQVAVVTFIMHV